MFSKKPIETNIPPMVIHTVELVPKTARTMPIKIRMNPKAINQIALDSARAALLLTSREVAVSFVNWAFKLPAWRGSWDGGDMGSETAREAGRFGESSIRIPSPHLGQDRPTEPPSNDCPQELQECLFMVFFE